MAGRLFGSSVMWFSGTVVNSGGFVKLATEMKRIARVEFGELVVFLMIPD